MRTVTVSWDADADRFTAIGSHAGQAIAINAPRSADRAGPPTGFSPTELLLAGAGSCAAWDVVQICRKGRMAIDAVEVRVSGEQASEPPWQYERVDLAFTVSGRGLRRRAVERAVRLSVERYCSVLATLRGVAGVWWTVELVDPEATTAPALPSQVVPADAGAAAAEARPAASGRTRPGS